MRQYKDLIEHILDHGITKKDRTGVGTRSVFGHQMRFDLTETFPIVTCKKTNVKMIINEFLWMVVEGSTDVRWLQERGHTFWNEWQKEDGTIGPGYGYQFRKANGIDQVVDVIESLRNDPDSRRHIITLWNPKDIGEMVLPPCHGVFVQLYSFKQGIGPRRLSCQVNTRSTDCALGLPVNISFWALFTNIIAHLTNHRPYELVVTLGDAHIYLNHLEAMEDVLFLPEHPLPTLQLNPRVNDINSYGYNDIHIEGYEHGPYVKLPVAV